MNPVRWLIKGLTKRRDARRRADVRAQMLTKARQRFRQLQARYDASQTTVENQNHWAWADDLSPARASNAATRHILRMRSRYEVLENNCWGLGMVLSKASDVIGRGPTIRLQSSVSDRLVPVQQGPPPTGEVTPRSTLREYVQAQFNAWLDEIGLAEKLRTAYLSKIVSGEVFVVAKNNRNLRHPVKLDLRLIEADQVAHPTFNSTGSTGMDDFDPLTTDGIHYDNDDNAVAYDILRQHPGSGWMNWLDYDTVAAEHVIHYFRRDRPEQPRGIPETAPALPLFAYIRRFQLATVAAAEIAADYAGVMETDAGALDAAGANFADLAPEEIMDVDRGSLVSLPFGWKLSQLKSEHPATTHEMFVEAVLSEIGRCLLMPYNRAAGKSVKYTFASGKLDRDTYLDHVDIEREVVEKQVLQRVWEWWLDEAALIPGVIPNGIGPLHLLKPAWAWPLHRETDPQKQAAADISYWQNGLLTDHQFLLGRNINPDDHYAQLAEQQRRRTEINGPLPGSAQPVDSVEPSAAALDDTELNDRLQMIEQNLAQ